MYAIIHWFGRCPKYAWNINQSNRPLRLPGRYSNGVFVLNDRISIIETFKWPKYIGIEIGFEWDLMNRKIDELFVAP